MFPCYDVCLTIKHLDFDFGVVAEGHGTGVASHDVGSGSQMGVRGPLGVPWSTAGGT